MRRFAMLLALLGCSVPEGTVEAQTTRVIVQSSGGDATGWLGGSAVRTRVMVGADGETYVGVWIDAPDQGAVEVVTRPPMAVSLVVDTSGSMSGPKIENARLAASSLIESLADGDIVSVYAFSNGVAEVAPPTTLGPMTRGDLMNRVRYLHAGGGTNLYGGVSTALQQLARSPSSHPVRRVFLVSDGQANVGPSDPASLGQLAANGTEWGAQVSAIGVGLDYDERTLGALAVQSSGRLWHLEQPYQLAAILEGEVQLLARTVATNAVIEIVPAPGVTILEPMTPGATVQGNVMRVPLGTVFAGQHRDVLFKARVDTARPGARELATARLQYSAPGAQTRPAVQSAPLRYEVVRDARAAETSAAPRVVAMVANVEAAVAQQRAAEALMRGDRAEAERQFQFADDRIDGALAAPVDAEVRTRLQSNQTRLRAARSRAASAPSPAAARGAALDAYDNAMEANGY
ncbi:MAG: VWA domain-containing protein [Sandaracinus sp.]|nr:VWA domain-containing protein [Myxococcales bacterium]MCB9534576.1 VWA domain-containing protein [Myxococcales bacterium]MCB9601858.1 VWA domain-containing protein [Sandaracinus sp.]MCB9611590.1 VWA domain-containing protein [Sandaracinus sp.]